MTIPGLFRAHQEQVGFIYIASSPYLPPPYRLFHILLLSSAWGKIITYRPADVTFQTPPCIHLDHHQLMRRILSWVENDAISSNQELTSLQTKLIWLLYKHRQIQKHACAHIHVHKETNTHTQTHIDNAVTMRDVYLYVYAYSCIHTRIQFMYTNIHTIILIYANVCTHMHANMRTNKKPDSYTNLERRR